MKRPVLIAHRGDTIHFPENTIEAFLSAFDKGADGVEMDVQLIDGEVRVIHDYLYDSTKTYPKLSDVLHEIGIRGHLEIEVKAFTPEILRPLADIIESFPKTDIELTTVELPMVPFIVKQFPARKVGVIFDECLYQDWMSEELLIRKIIELMRTMNAHVAHLSNLPLNVLTSSVVNAMHTAGYLVHYHIGRMPMTEQIALYQKLLNLGVDQCTFDDSNLISAVPGQSQVRRASSTTEKSYREALRDRNKAVKVSDLDEYFQ